MDSHNDAPHQIEKIRQVFQHALKVATEGSESEIQEHLIKANIEFRAVAYEAVAMGLALKDLSIGTLQYWRDFMRKSESQYLPHIHVGLGWAVAKQKISSLIFLENLNPLMLFRVVDGFGYYEGTFRMPQSIYAKKRSEAIKLEAFQAYDQGLGRSIWYNCNGDSEKAAMIIHSFPTERQPDLWRGIGVACSFVGKSDEKTLLHLLESATENRVQLAIGAAFSARARVQSNTITFDAENACRLWCKLSAKEAMLLAVNTEPFSSLNPYDGYRIWLTQMELSICNMLKLRVTV